MSKPASNVLSVTSALISLKVKSTSNWKWKSKSLKFAWFSMGIDHSNPSTTVLCDYDLPMIICIAIIEYLTNWGHWHRGSGKCQDPQPNNKYTYHKEYLTNTTGPVMAPWNPYWRDVYILLICPCPYDAKNLIWSLCCGTYSGGSRNLERGFPVAKILRARGSYAH